MKFTTRLAVTPEDRELVFRLRYQVFAEEHSYLNPQDYPREMEYDIYDDRAALLLTTCGDEPAATMRIIAGPGPEADFSAVRFFREHPLPTGNQFFRLLSELKKKGRTVAEGSRVAIPAAYQRTRAFLSLVQAAYLFCRNQGFTDMVGLCNCCDNIPHLYTKIGFRAVGSSFYYESFKSWVQLMHGCPENLTGRHRQAALPPAAQW